MAKYQSFSQGWRSSMKEDESRRKDMSLAFEKFKESNPDATAAEFQQYVSTLVGNKPWLRGSLPAKEIMDQIGARNQERLDFQRRDDMFSRAEQKAKIEGSLQKMIEEDMLHYDPNDIESGKAVTDFASSHPEMFASQGGAEPLFKESMISRYLNPQNYQRKQASWFAEPANQNTLTSWLKSNPEGDSKAFATYMKMPEALVQGRFDEAKKEARLLKKKAARDERKDVLAAVMGDENIQEAFNNTASEAESTQLITTALENYYGGSDDEEYQAFINDNNDIKGFILKKLQAQYDKSTRGINAAKRKELRTGRTALIAGMQEKSAAYASSYFGEAGKSRAVFGDMGNAVSTYISKLSGTHLIDQNSIGLLDAALHEAKGQGIKGIKELNEFMAGKEQSLGLTPVNNLDAMEQRLNSLVPTAQPAGQWATQTAHDLRAEKKGITDAVNRIAVSATTDPAAAIRAYKSLLFHIESRYPMQEGILVNVNGSAYREIQDDITNEGTWRTGGDYAQDIFNSEIAPELEAMTDGMQELKEHINTQIKTLIEADPVLSDTVRNTTYGPNHLRPPRFGDPTSSSQFGNTITPQSISDDFPDIHNRTKGHP